MSKRVGCTDCRCVLAAKPLLCPCTPTVPFNCSFYPPLTQPVSLITISSDHRSSLGSLPLHNLYHLLGPRALGRPPRPGGSLATHRNHRSSRIFGRFGKRLKNAHPSRFARLKNAWSKYRRYGVARILYELQMFRITVRV